MKKRFSEKEVFSTKEILEDLALNTICESASCPNRSECFSKKTATFLILGDICTRNCRFCGVKKGRPLPLDPTEPERVTEAARRLELKYLVITSVTRDDLSDGGAEYFAQTIKKAKKRMPEIKVEVLTPDFKGSEDSLRTVLLAKPEVFNHNIETIERLYPEVRPEANYQRSLKVLKFAKEDDFITKSGIMLGLGEEKEEVISAMEDLREVGCDYLTIGQYLKPNKKALPVKRFVTPEEFEEYKEIGEGMGFRGIASGPFVRSSYKAEELITTKARKTSLPQRHRDTESTKKQYIYCS